MRLGYARIEALSPAVPELYSGGRHFRRSAIRDGVVHSEYVDEGAVEPVGLRLEKDGYRLVYLPFDWPFAGGKAVGRQQLGSSLAFLHQLNSATVVELQVPDHELLDDDIKAVWFDREVPIQARVGADVRAVDVVVRGHSGLAPIIRIPMQRTGIEAGMQLFETRFAAPNRDHYSLSLHLQPADGPAYAPTPTLQIAALLFADQAPVLVYISEFYGFLAKASLRALLEKILAAKQLEASFLDGQPGDAALFARHVHDKELVIALGELPEPELREALAGFLNGGGRLLLSSKNLINASTATTSLRELLRIAPAAAAGGKFTSGVISPDNSFKARSFALYQPLQSTAPAIPVLLDSKGEFVIGLKIGLVRGICG